MTTYKELNKEFQSKVKELQETCPHKAKEWLEKCYFPGHSCGYKVQICKRCNKELAQDPPFEERKKRIKYGRSRH